jgi:hypothetical protein
MIMSRTILAAALLLAAPAFAQTTAPAKAPAALQQEFTGFIARFRAALKDNDAAAIAGMTRLPFPYGEAKLDAAQFRTTAYPKLFTAKARGCLQREKATYDRDPEKSDNFFVFCGQSIFVFTKTPAGFLFTEVGAND